MKKKNKKENVVLLAAVLAGIVLIAGSLASTAQEKVTLKYMSWYVREQGEIEEEWLKLWQAEHPNIMVKKISPPAAGLDYQQKLFAMNAADRAPDVCAVDTWSSQEIYKRGVCVNLDPLIARDKIDLGRFREPFVEEGRSGYDGKLYGLPWGPADKITMFNMDIFDKAGLAYPKKGWTFDDMVALGKKLTQDFNGDGIIDQWGLKCLAQWEAFSNFVYQNGARYVNRETNKVAITEPEFTSVMQFIADLDLKHHIMPSMSEQAGYGSVWVAEIGGQFAMWFMLGSGTIAFYKQIELHEKFDYGTTYLPRPNKEAPIISFGKGNSIVIIKGTKHPEEAWEFVKWTISDEAQAYLAKTLLYPATKKAVQLPDFISPPGLAPNLLEPEAFPMENVYHLPYDVPGWTEMFWKIFGPQSDLVWSGDKTAVEAMKEIESECNSMLEEARKEAIEIQKVIEAMED